MTSHRLPTLLAISLLLVSCGGDGGSVVADPGIDDEPVFLRRYSYKNHKLAAGPIACHTTSSS